VKHKDTFLSATSHELRTPLHAIMGEPFPPYPPPPETPTASRPLSYTARRCWRMRSSHVSHPWHARASLRLLIVATRAKPMPPKARPGGGAH
jgi:signal transduction histidine kinase